MSAADAAKQADIVNILLPDEVQADVYRSDIRAEPEAGQRADVLARVQRPLRPGRRRQGRRRAAGGAQGPGPPGPQRIRRRRRRAVPHRHGRRRQRRDAQDRPGLRQGHRRHARRRHSHHLCRRNRNRPVRRASRALRRRRGAGEGGLRNARRSRLPARDGLLRVHARAEADRRPVLPGRPQLHALQRLATRPSTATTPAARGSSPTRRRRR